MLAPVRNVDPAAPPVSLIEAKAHLRVDFSDDDTIITSLIDAATMYLDGWTGILGRALVTQTWRQDFDLFEQCLPLPLGPVQSVESITWRNTSGQIATVDSDDYALMTDGGGRSFVRFKDAYSLPGDLYETAAVSITFVAGYGDSAAVPAPIKAAILMLVAHWYENREASVVGVSVERLPMAVDALLAPYRRVGL